MGSSRKGRAERTGGGRVVMGEGRVRLAVGCGSIINSSSARSTDVT